LKCWLRKATLLPLNTEINQCLNIMIGNEKLFKKITSFTVKSNSICFKSSFSFTGLREKVYKHIGREEIIHSKLQTRFIWRKPSEIDVFLLQTRKQIKCYRLLPTCAQVSSTLYFPTSADDYNAECITWTWNKWYRKAQESWYKSRFLSWLVWLLVTDGTV
jgi:hypothetical protein